MRILAHIVQAYPYTPYVHTTAESAASVLVKSLVNETFRVFRTANNSLIPMAGRIRVRTIAEMRSWEDRARKATRTGRMLTYALYRTTREIRRTSNGNGRQYGFSCLNQDSW
jgi:hypothetical protein